MARDLLGDCGSFIRYDRGNLQVYPPQIRTLDLNDNNNSNSEYLCS